MNAYNTVLIWCEGHHLRIDIHVHCSRAPKKVVSKGLDWDVLILSAILETIRPGWYVSHKLPENQHRRS